MTKSYESFLFQANNTLFYFNVVFYKKHKIVSDQQNFIQTFLSFYCKILEPNLNKSRKRRSEKILDNIFNLLQNNPETYWNQYKYKLQ